MDRVYECLILLQAAWALLKSRTAWRWQFAVPMAALALWGFFQWATGATVDREVTWISALRLSGLAGAALLAHETLASSRAREQFLCAMAWFGFLVSIVSVLAYYTSPGRVLWLIEAPYPDTWGPFLSRNNFAQFLELTFPVALWIAGRASSPVLYGCMGATMLAAGLASASRAGAVLLLLEVIGFLWARYLKEWRRALLFVAAASVLAVVGGVQTLIGRFSDRSPFAYRDRIYASTVEMIASRPLRGYGLGTYAWVYPRFAKTDFGYRIEHAHSDWLEWAGEGGLGFLAIWTWLAARAIRKSLSHPWAWGITALFAHALVDFPLARFGVAAWAFILIGAIESNETRPHQTLRRTT